MLADSPGAYSGELLKDLRGTVKDTRDGLFDGGMVSFAVIVSPGCNTTGIPSGCWLLVVTAIRK